MVSIDFIVFGKLKEKHYKDAVNEYLKRLGRYAKISVVELKPVNLSQNPSEKEIENALLKEGQMIEEKLVGNSYKICLCIEGEQLSSENLAAEIRKINIGGTGKLQFIIGSSFGISKEIKAKANLRLSFSKMTFPHELARVILAEQVYRAMTILENGKYHK